MGEDTHSPTVGLVVPAFASMRDDDLVLSPSDAAAMEAVLRSAPSNGSKPLDAPGLHLDVRPGPAKGIPPNRSSATLDLSIAIQALQNAQRGADALRSGMLPHQRAKVLIDPISQLEHAMRCIEAQLERWR